MKISIIVTCYNYGRFVSDAIQSALNQTYKNIEVIVVNDGSTDNSHEVINQFKDKVIYINQNNSGAAQARNNGIAKSTGDYIICLDADDCISEYYVEHAMTMIDDEYSIINPIVVFTDSMLNPTSQTWPTDYVIKTISHNANNILLFNWVTGGSMFSRKLWELSGGYDNDTPRAEDWLFWISLVYLGAKIKLLMSNDIFYYKYRRHGKSRTNLCSDEIIIKYVFQKYFQVDSRLDSIKKLYEVILNREADEIGLSHYFNSELSLIQIRDILFNSEEYRQNKFIK
jgi:glycosyltransferase involved in cell wall biosynthesis